MFQSIALERLAKAVTTSTIDALVPEDLEAEAHNTLWRASDATELTLLKLIPNIPAKQIAHEFDQVTSYGESRGFGFVVETSLPRSTTPVFARKTTNIRLIGEYSETFLLASLEKTIKVEGATGADAIAKQTLLLSILRKKNKALYFSDTSTHRQGVNGPRFKGLIQQIREGTDGTEGTSPYGSHIIDMEGQPLTISNIRAKAAKNITLFGRFNCLIMDPFARADMEDGMDAAQRLDLPIMARPFILGQHIGGFQTQGGAVWFHTDNTLAPLYAQGQYTAVAEELAPTSPPVLSTVTAGAPGGGRESKFLAADAGEFFWIVTEVKNDRESLGRRVPTSSEQAVAAGEEATFTVTPSDPTSDSFRIYRGNAGDADTDAYFAFEVSNSGGGAAVTVHDDNLYRPNTSVALGLNIRTEASEFLHSSPDGTRPSYSMAVENSEKFLGMPDNPRNTVTCVTLGPTMGTMELATVLMTTSRPLVYSAFAPQCRNPLQNVVFINVGSRSRVG